MTARIQNSGLARVTGLMNAVQWWMQWGTGSGAPAAANAVTTAGTTEPRSACVTSQITTNVTNDTLQLVGAIVAAGTRTITEVGSFDALGAGSPPTGGNMDLYADFGAITLGVGDAITFTLAVTFS